MIWIHVGEAANTRAVVDLAHRMVSARQGCTVVLTDVDGLASIEGDPGLIAEALPVDHPDLTEAFVQHWKPDVVVWTWGGLRPNLILSAADSGAYMMLVDAARNGFERRRDRWLPEVPRRLLARFETVIARSQPAHMRLAQLGRPLSDIEIAAPLRPFGRTLPAADTDLTDMAEALGGRATWLAANVQQGELTTVIAAHRQALKTSHRLLLILQIPDSNHLTTTTAVLRKRGLRFALWADGEMPDDNTQVLIAETDDDLGLWLRIAPVVLIGGTLLPGDIICDPYTVAAHGAAILYGNHVGQHGDALNRLLNAGAARLARDASDLGTAVTEMTAPDRAAQMAIAGWDVTTQGAESLDRVIGLIQTKLDAKLKGAT